MKLRLFASDFFTLTNLYLSCDDNLYLVANPLVARFICIFLLAKCDQTHCF